MSHETCIRICNSLLRGELSAIETYQQALEKFSTVPEVSQLRELLDSHSEHALVLRNHVTSMHGEPSADSGAWGAFAKAVEGTAKLFGESAALQALIAGEKHGISEYEDALDEPGVMEEIKTVFRTDIIPALSSNIATLEKLQIAA